MLGSVAIKKNAQGVLLCGIMLAIPGHSETTSAQMAVSAFVASVVHVNIEPITFNLVNAGAGSAVAEFQLQFDSPASPPMITLGSGDNDFGEQRRMSDGNGNFIPYSLMQSGVVLTKDTEVAMTQTAPQVFRAVIDATVYPTTGAPAGTYNDIVIVTVGFSP